MSEEVEYEPEKYPEHEKLREISDLSGKVGDFLMWLTREKGYHICEEVPVWRDLSSDSVRALENGEWMDNRFQTQCNSFGEPPLPLILHGLVEDDGIKRPELFDPVGNRRWVEVTDTEEARQRVQTAIDNSAYPSSQTQLAPARFQQFPHSLLADYFDIDLDKIEEEKQEMLEEMRAANREGG